MAEGFEPVLTAEAVPSKEYTQERREREHHWIARGGWAVVPRGYRSPIGLAGGSRLRMSDPRVTGLTAGRREYRRPAVASADNGETPTLGPRVPFVAPGVPCDAEVE